MSLTQRLASIAATAFVLLAFPGEACAYLDPGTGSMLLSVIIGVLSSVYFLIRQLPSTLRALVFRLRSRSQPVQSRSIVFYSESRSYWSTFEPVLRALHRRGVAVTYLTSDPKDPVFEAGWDDTVQACFIGTGQTAWTGLGFIEADCFVLTTPGIDVLQIRRSKGVRNYVHIVHAACDIHTYKFYSFDYFDTVICSGPGQVASLRELEAKRGTRAKALPVLGCPYFDRLVARRNAEAVPLEPRTVLVAPTWGANSLLTRTGARIPLLLAHAGWHVILRPHPQSFISDKAMMERVLADIAQCPAIELDRNPDGFPSLARSAAMISDISGVILDYAFTFLRPVISIGEGPKKDGFEAWELDHPAWDQEALS